MTDQKKPRNPANALFGLDDVPTPPGREVKSSETQRPAGQGQPGSSGSYGFSFGQPAAPAQQAKPAAPAGVEPPPQGRPEEYSQATSPSTPPPQYVYVQAPSSSAPASATSGVPKGLWALVIILLIISGVNLYLVLTSRSRFSDALSKQSDQLNVLSHRADSSDEQLAQLGAKFAVTAQRLGMTRAELGRARQLAVNIERQQKQAVTNLNAAIAEKASSEQVNSLQTQANAKFGSISGSLAGTQKDLAATQQALTGTKGELTGAIARTHNELVELAHRTDRDYFEFALRSKGARQRIGGLQVQLVKTNTKNNLFTVNLFFDDKRTQRKNESIDEPVFFYMQGAASALEMVVNHVGKNAVAGYVSAPKGFIVNAKNVLTARPTA